jgi:hypothetical protein
MNSSTLKEKGFTDSVSLQGINFSSLPTNKGVVLVLADNSLAGKPASDILYIGRSKKLAKRVFGGYLAGYGGKTTRKINSKLADNGYMDKVTISWMESDNPKQAQQQLLDDFKNEHGDCPPWNLSKKSSVANVQPAAAKIAPTRSARKRPAAKRSP